MEFCPFKGLLPYSEEDERYFFGRTTERRVIRDNLCASRLTVLYGPSGVGKSSVLGAGVVHDLRKDPDYVVVYFGTQGAWRSEPVASLNAALQVSLTSLPGFKANGNRQPPPGLFPDLSEQLDNVDRTLLVILDQFEEYFQYHPIEAAEADFARQFPSLLCQRDVPVHFLLSLREDMLAVLDRFKKRIPNLFNNRLRIDFLSREDALEAVLKPLDVFNQEGQPPGPMTIQRETAERLLDRLARIQKGDRRQVQTPYLQLVMENWWHREVKDESHEMREETLQALGGVETIVDRHLEATLKKLGPDAETLAASLFQFMVTPGGRKIAQTTSELAGNVAGNYLEGAVKDLLQKLRDSRVLTTVPLPPDSAPGEQCYEFAHDVMAKAARDWGKCYRETQEERCRRQKEEEARQRQAEELAEAKRSEEEARLRAEEQYRFAQERSRLATRFKRLFWGLAAVVLAAACIGIYAWKQHRSTERARIESYVRAAALAADRNLRTDPELAVLLAEWAVRQTYQNKKNVIPEAEDALRRGLQSLPAGVSIGPSNAHRNRVSVVAFNRDGTRFATGSWDKTARIWNVATGEPLSPPFNHPAEVVAVCFNADGTRVATVSAEGTASLWEATSGQQLMSFSVGDYPSGVAFSPGAVFLAAGNADGITTVWDVQSNKRLTTLSDLKGHHGPVSELVFSPNSAFLATAYEDGTLQIWDSKSGRSLRTLSIGHRSISDLSYSGDANELAIAGADGTVTILEVNSGKLIHLISGRRTSISRLALDYDGQRLATSSDEGRVRLWDVASSEELRLIFRHKDYISALAFSPDRLHLATASADGAAKVWDVSPESTGGVVLTLPAPQAYGALFAAKGKLLVIGSQSTVEVRDPNSGKLQNKFAVPNISNLSTSHEQARWGIVTEDQGVQVSDLTASRSAPFKACKTGDASKHASWGDFSQDFNKAVVADSEGSLKICENSSGKTLSLPGRDFSSNGAMRPDGGVVAVGGWDGTLSLWDTSSGKKLNSWPASQAEITNVIYSYDGKWLATISHDNLAKIWDGSSKSPVVTLSGHRGAVTAVAFAEERDLVATGSLDGTAKVWNVSSPDHPKEIYNFDHGTAVRWVDLSPDGHLLATTTADGYVRVYHLKIDVDQLMGMAQKRVHRRFTEEDCESYLPQGACPDRSNRLARWLSDHLSTN
jgi:WD40 repeat protein